MAQMIPPDVEQFVTDGERRFYRFLEAVAKPDPEFLVWYSPDIEGREPDFILYHDKIGLLIFEVKDWAIDQIVKADRNQFRLIINGKEEARTNPLKQADQYRNQVFNAIKRDGKLLSREPAFYGKPRVPVATAAVLTNINKREFLEMGLDKVVDLDRTFFWDDLHPQAPYSEDPSGRTFRESLQQKFPPLFPFSLSGADKNHLKQILFPQIRVQNVRRALQPNFEAQNKSINALDHHQEVFARKFDGGHYLIKGASGSGKTLVLVHKAAFLLRYNREIKRILYVCYNLALVSYVKRLLAQLQVPLGKSGVEVLPFYALCARIIDDKVEHQDREGNIYYSMILEESLKKSTEYQKYDAILLDEAQDFSDDMLKVLVNILNPHTNNLTIVLDDSQNIYAKKQSWKKLGIKIQGRTRRLDHVYRTTQELTRFAARFARQLPDAEKQQTQQELFPESFDFSGPQPVVKQLSDLPKLIDYVSNTIAKLVIDRGYGLAEIAIIYISKDIPGEDQLFPVLIHAALEQRGVLSTWSSQDTRSKAAYDITTDTVTISTAHSVKGLDYAAVFVVGLDMAPEERWPEKQLEKIAYVAITRARYRLYVPFISKTKLIEKIIGSIL